MRIHGAAVAFLLALAAMPALAQPPPSLSPPLAPIGFLVGDWTSGQGKVSDTGETASGRSHISIEAGGAVLLRRDHTDLADASGKPSGGFDQIMTIWPEAGTLHADYFDGAHVIHYVSAAIEPGRFVSFTSAASASAPTFRLTYRLTAPDTLSIWFGMAAPGASDFHPIAEGTATRSH
jgi:hypothetical protein